MNLRFALYLAIALVPSLVLHEYAHALVAVRLGDPTPRSFGRLTLNPAPHVDPFGTLILPAFLLILVASGRILPPVFAYAKPMPLNPSNTRGRGWLAIPLAGPLVNLALAVVAALGLRLVGTGELALFVLAFLQVNVVMFVFQLMPVPGLDGSSILAHFLPPRPRAVYRNLDQYLPLFMLLVYFLLSGTLLAIVNALGNALCGVLVGGDCLVGPLSGS